MTSPLFLCTGARPEICLSPKNIRIPAQEGRLGFSAAWAEGQRAGGEERWRQQRSRKRKEKRASFLGRFPAARFWSVRLAPCSLGPVEQSTGRLPCNWDSSFHTENGTGTPRHRRVQIPRLCVDFAFHFKTVSNSKISNYTQTKSSYIKKKSQIRSLKWALIMNRWINISLLIFPLPYLFSHLMVINVSHCCYDDIEHWYKVKRKA